MNEAHMQADVIFDLFNMDKPVMMCFKNFAAWCGKKV